MGDLNPHISGDTTNWQKQFTNRLPRRMCYLIEILRRTVDTSQKVLESANMILYWDRSVITDNMVDLNKADRVLTDRENTTALVIDRGADKSLARPGRKQATETEDFEFHISYL